MHDEMPKALAELIARWRAEAEVLRRHGYESSAKRLEEYARDVERAWRAYLEEELSTQEAARISGYSADHLGDMARKGDVAARKVGNEWRFRRGDLPRKARPATGDVVEEMTDLLLESRR